MEKHFFISIIFKVSASNEVLQLNVRNKGKKKAKQQLYRYRLRVFFITAVNCLKKKAYKIFFRGIFLMFFLPIILFNKFVLIVTGNNKKAFLKSNHLLLFLLHSKTIFQIKLDR